ncbi:uncharacterized protein FTOL_13228 [Fusarium torulosum]|uniref:Uncharacterized protein n=1 Tax=Fusarium torulosum TaxID=33205 RepID=A0AAE8MNH8_9HYPO|nr:uncharacterized protein FTOL_13228 [Fusarium torulosum]
MSSPLLEPPSDTSATTELRACRSRGRAVPGGV